ncbi:MAG TPA: hypothetical protein VFQ45_01990 [Longimicrobium sp.]|nr:hypothetical protein [Longimicrobium sp.]
MNTADSLLRPRIFVLLFAAAAAAACGGGSGDAESNTATPAASADTPAAAAASEAAAAPAPAQPAPPVPVPPSVQETLKDMYVFQQTWRAEHRSFTARISDLETVGFERPQPAEIAPFIFNEDADGDGTLYCLAAQSTRRCMNLNTGEIVSP